MSISVRRLSSGLGAEILGADLTRPLSDGDIAQIRKAWIDHNVLLIRGQEISPEQHIAFSARFGALEDHAAMYKFRHPEHPEIFIITTKPNADGSPSDTRETGSAWHSDMTYTLRPANGSLLYSMEIPEVGGDTLFSNSYLAYETLSEPFRKLIDPLWAVHDLAYGLRNTGKNRKPETVAAHTKANPPVLQPMVKPHPESGRKALYVNETATSHIVGVTPEESRTLLQYLFQHSVRPEFTYRHRWHKHDLVMWDNRCTMHFAMMDRAPGSIRHMHRTTLVGEPSGRLYQEA